MKLLLTLLVTISAFAPLARAAEELSYEEMLTSREYQEAGHLIEEFNDTKGQGLNLMKLMAENRGIRNFLLQRMLNVRCERYLNFLEEIPCSTALWNMIKALDFDVKILDETSTGWRPQSFVFVAFKNQLVSLLNTQRTGEFLTQVLMKMSAWRADPSKNRFNLWQTAVSFYQSEQMAAAVLAVLFQDTSISQVHMEYLGSEGIRGNRFFSQNVDLLNNTITFLHDVMSADKTGFNQAVYPSGLAGQFNNNPYHFYVPYYLAFRLNIDGTSKKYSVIAPTILSTTYEFITLKSDSTYLYKDPKQITSQYVVRDIHSGYTGARYGAKLKAGGPSLSKLYTLFARSTDDGVEALFDNL